MWTRNLPKTFSLRIWLVKNDRLNLNEAANQCKILNGYKHCCSNPQQSLYQSDINIQVSPGFIPYSEIMIISNHTVLFMLFRIELAVWPLTRLVNMLGYIKPRFSEPDLKYFQTVKQFCEFCIIMFLIKFEFIICA